MNFKKNLYVWTGSQTYVYSNCVVLSILCRRKNPKPTTKKVRWIWAWPSVLRAALFWMNIWLKNGVSCSAHVHAFKSLSRSHMKWIGIGESSTKWRSDNIEGQHKEQMQQDATHKWLLEWFPKQNRKCMNNSERCEKQEPSKSKNKRSFNQIHEEDQQDWWSRSGGEECHDRRGQNLHDNFRHWERTWNFLLTAMVYIVEKQAEKTRKETQPKSVRKLSNISWKQRAAPKSLSQHHGEQARNSQRHLSEMRRAKPEWLNNPKIATNIRKLENQCKRSTTHRGSVRI